MAAQLCPDSHFPHTRCTRDCDWGSGCKAQRDRAELAARLALRVKALEQEIHDLRAIIADDTRFGMPPS